MLDSEEASHGPGHRFKDQTQVITANVFPEKAKIDINDTK